ncbi:MAG: hypothetical protein KJN72_12280 [Woeseia sp.]|nr:hypothetical protein [Woeseia sp.]
MKTTHEQRITACEQTIADMDAAIKNSEAVIAAQGVMIKRLREEVARIRDPRAASWWNDDHPDDQAQELAQK